MSNPVINKYEISQTDIDALRFSYRDVPIDFLKREYRTKLIKSGSMVEVFEYNLLPRINSDREKRNEYDNRVFEPKYIERRYNKLKSEVTRLVECNSFNRHITLTYKTNQLDVSVGYKDLKSFIRKLGTHLNENFEYIAILEFQTRGAVHFHILINCSYVDVRLLNRLWGMGGVNIERIYNKNTIARYFSKYVSKDLCDVRFYRKKKYSTSKNLQRPQVYYNEDAQNIINSCSGLTLQYQKVINSPFLGEVKYYVYRSDNPIVNNPFQFKKAVSEVNGYYKIKDNRKVSSLSP